MSQENVELHRRGYDAFNRRDLEAWLALADPDAEMSPATVGLEGTYHGHAGARRFWRDFFETFPDLRVEVDEIRDLGETNTFARARLVGHGAGSQASVERPVWHVMEWRNERCVEWRSFPTEAEALEAAGLSE